MSSSRVEGDTGATASFVDRTCVMYVPCAQPREVIGNRRAPRRRRTERPIVLSPKLMKEGRLAVRSCR